jgi:hypothetical protein
VFLKIFFPARVLHFTASGIAVNNASNELNP